MDTIEKLTEIFKEFPGIGERQAKRFVYFLMSRNKSYSDNLSSLILDLKKEISQCGECFRFFILNNKINLPANKQICDICGNPKVSSSANTIAQNVANSTNGHIIYAVNGINHKLSSAYVFTAFSNTIVENNAFSTFYYDNNGIIGLSFNILAYNQGKSCRYALNNGNVKDVELPLVASQNALQLNAGVGQCDLPEKATSNSDNSNKNCNFILC